ncbi:MAG TPA: lipid II flippase MurJ, partial [Micromonosporaceae bacterium]
MSGGLYRSANAMPEGEQPPADGVPVVSTRPGGQPQDMPDAESSASAVGVEETGSAARNSAVMAIGSLVSRGTGFLRTVAVTAALGVAVGDAYTTAQIFPGLVYEFLLGGVLTSVVVPVLVRRRKADPDRGEAYAQRLITLAVLALAATTVLALLAAPLLTWVYAGDTSGDYRRLVTTLSYLMLPMIFFMGLSALLAALLNTRGHFAAPMWTPILNNLVVIGTGGLYLLMFGAKPIRPEEVSAAQLAVIGGGTLLGIVVQS